MVRFAALEKSCPTCLLEGHFFVVVNWFVCGKITGCAVKCLDDPARYFAHDM